MNNHSRVCVLTSGGVESGAMLYLLAKKYRQVYPLYVSHGFIWEKAEIHWLKQFIRALKTGHVRKVTVLHYPLASLYGRHWSVTGKNVPSAYSKDETVFLPGRNILLLSLASVFCYTRNIPSLALGSLATNPFPDSSPDFFKSFERSLSLGYGWKIKIIKPFAGLKKNGAIKLARRAPFELTFSCLNPRGRRHCGKCNKCEERKKAGLPLALGEGPFALRRPDGRPFRLGVGAQGL